MNESGTGLFPEENARYAAAYWKEYWSGFRPHVVRSSPFDDIFRGFPSGPLQFIEIGGFPGTFCVYFSKHKGYDVTLLDSHMDRDAVRGMEEINGLPRGTIRLIEADFLSFRGRKRYDIVFSAGFLEHFSDIELVLGRHAALLVPGGMLCVSVPNFLGINGLVQRVLDKRNYAFHNTEAMDMKRLEEACISLGLKNCRVFHFGRPTVWLEDSAPAGVWARTAVRLLAKALGRINLRNKLLSPYIMAIAEKAR